MIHRNIHIILVCILYSFIGIGQNIHFAQYYDHPTLFNAATAVDLQPRGVEIGGIFRDQAFTATSNSFQTFAVDTRMGLLSNDDYNIIGLSLNVLHDRVGTGSLTANQAFLGLGLQTGISTNHRIAIGGQIGFIQRSIGDINAFTFEEEILGSTLTEFADFASSQYLDFNGGILYTFVTRDDTKFSLGASLQNVSPSSSIAGQIDKYQRRLVGHASFQYDLTQRLQITPRAFYQSNTDGASEIVAQTQLSYATGRYSNTRIYSGLGWRLFDAAQFIVGMESANWKFGLGYEINTSSQRAATGLASALELSFLYRIQREKKEPKKEEPVELPPLFHKILLSSNVEGVENPDSIDFILMLENDTLSKRYFEWPNIDSLEKDTNYKIIVSKENYNIDSVSFNTFDITSDTIIYHLLRLERTNPPIVDTPNNQIDSSLVEELTTETTIDTSSITSTSDTTTMDRNETKVIYKDVPIILEKIFYDFDDAGILPESEKELTDLYDVLIRYPEIKIELSSHTDIHGSHAYNNRLSQQRANAATKWLTDRGIDPSRIVSKGYGETKLINHCKEGTPCSEELHRQNRRTEFKIIEGPTFITVPVSDF